jgi:predicted dehydrogenase/threonine dehydrogenase-like Zn-dependent dehydrogenase
LKQILQSLKSGITEVADVPAPRASHGSLLIHTSRTLISAGTERMLVEFGKANLLEKARQQPDKVRMVLDKVRTDGLLPTYQSVRNKLDQPLSLGYCNVGVVTEVGSGVTGFAVGDRVASNGKHAEVVSVPQNLCVRVPDAVPDDHAAFAVLGAIALQGVRLVQPTLGEVVVVTGLGLIGLVTVQLLRANGCRVLGLDFDPAKLAMARQFGAETVDLSAGEDPVAAAHRFSRGRGVDAVLITAATQSNEPMHQAALMCRQRGRIVLVGVTGLELSRDDFFKKEITFQVSSSYGPGRYDPNYEEKGQDYPFGFVRWTEQRNFEAVLDMIADARLDVGPLISHRFPVAEAANAYELVSGGGPSLGILLDYPKAAGSPQRTIVLPASGRHADTPAAQAATVSFVGSGNYATSVLIPAFKAAGARLRSVASSGGVSGLHAGRKFGFEQTTTDTASVFADPETSTVVITTRHDTHARLVQQALGAGKNVFVEKPLCLTLPELAAIETLHDRVVAAGGGPRLMVGFNRRFAPHVMRMRRLLQGATGPKAFVMTVNAGALPAEHWTQDPAVGGGRIIGEGCHFIDLLRFLADAPITGFQASAMKGGMGDTATLQLDFADGSIGTVHYYANGSKAFPKERLEIFASGRVLQLDNYRVLTGFGWPGFTSMKLWSQDKGQKACAAAFVRAVEQGLPSPIPISDLLEVSRVTIEAGEALRSAWR